MAAARLRVDAHRRLVHKEQAGPVQQPHADVDAALHAAGIGLDALVGSAGQPDVLQHLLDAAGERLAAQVVHLSPEQQVFPPGQVVVEGQFLRHDADGPPYRHRILRDRVPGDDGVALRGRIERG